MKKFILGLIGIAVAVASYAKSGDTKVYKVDNKISKLEWKGEKITKEHNGTIAVKEGKLEVNDGKILSGLINFDMSSIVCMDMEGEYKTKLENHLKSADFFDVENNPISQLKITSVKKSNNDEDGYDITGELTIKGITNEISFPATILFKDKNLVAVGEVKVDRTKYDIKYGSGSFFHELGDKAIYDDFTIKFKLGAKI